MIGFLIRKTFYDLWDNMFKIVLINLGFIACTAIPIFLPGFVGSLTGIFALEIIFSALGILVCTVYLSGVSYALRLVSDYGSFGFAEFFDALKKAWPAGIAVGFIVFIIFLIFMFVIPFYLTMEPPIVGLLLAAVVFWTTIFCILSFQFFFTVYTRLGMNIKKTFKKCMIISLDNSGLSIFLIIHNIIVLAISAIFAFMFPGPAGILLYLDQALRLRLLKYDYLEANPDANRRKIPWDALLIEEREKTGTRSLKNFIFPWKD